jgi:hypothetical protein
MRPRSRTASSTTVRRIPRHSTRQRFRFGPASQGPCRPSPAQHGTNPQDLNSTAVPERVACCWRTVDAAPEQAVTSGCIEARLIRVAGQERAAVLTTCCTGRTSGGAAGSGRPVLHAQRGGSTLRGCHKATAGGVALFHDGARAALFADRTGGRLTAEGALARVAQVAAFACGEIGPGIASVGAALQ